MDLGCCDVCDPEHGSVLAGLRVLSVLDDKHIPTSYLRGSQRQRRGLLAGLLDTHGTVTSGGCAQFRTTSERMHRDFYELVVGLGYCCGVSRKLH